MDTFLLAWNPKRWEWSDLDDYSERVRRAGVCHATWSCGTRKTIAPGNRFFLIRLGVEPKGIIGAGRIVSAPFEDAHWDSAREAAGETGWFVEVEFDSLSKQPLISWENLHNPPLDEMHWATQMSGVKIPSPLDSALEALWLTVNLTTEIVIPEELLSTHDFWEGAARKISVNVYERDPAARRACITHYGAKCCVCEFDFGKMYGSIATHYIHVHHIVPLSKVRKSYKIDPINDLRPVCPNCHAVIHLRRDPYEIEEVKAFLRQAS
jgi:5-methylcytosine-specific restriction enzyme A